MKTVHVVHSAPPFKAKLNAFLSMGPTRSHYYFIVCSLCVCESIHINDSCRCSWRLLKCKCTPVHHSHSHENCRWIHIIYYFCCWCCGCCRSCRLFKIVVVQSLSFRMIGISIWNFQRTNTNTKIHNSLGSIHCHLTQTYAHAHRIAQRIHTLKQQTTLQFWLHHFHCFYIMILYIYDKVAIEFWMRLYGWWRIRIEIGKCFLCLNVMKCVRWVKCIRLFILVNRRRSQSIVFPIVHDGWWWRSDSFRSNSSRERLNEPIWCVCASSFSFWQIIGDAQVVVGQLQNGQNCLFTVIESYWSTLFYVHCFDCCSVCG